MTSVPEVIYHPKDFLLTPEGLVFAIVAPELEDGKILGFLRYRHTPAGWQKLPTEAANALLTDQYPSYWDFSVARDTACHAVLPANISHHFQPQQHLQQLLQTCPADPVLQACVELVHLLETSGD